MTQERYIRWFKDLRMSDTPLVGGKTSSLGELYAVLSSEGILVPNGFGVTATAYRDALDDAGAWDKLRQLVGGLEKVSVGEVSMRAAEARAIVYRATGTDVLRRQIASSYRRLEEEYGRDVSVAVRSSATAEDLPDASFAGQHDSFSTSAARRPCSRPAGNVSRPFSPTGHRLPIDNGFDHSRSPCRWR